MDIATIFRIIVPFISVLLLTAIIKLTKAPKEIVLKALSVCWVAGILNAVIDFVAAKSHLWHYTLGYLLLDLPLDFYVSVSLAYGAGVCLLFWRIKTNHRKYLLPFIVILPFWGLLRDAIGTGSTGSTFLVWDNPHWYIADFLAWMIVLWLTIFLFQKRLQH